MSRVEDIQIEKEGMREEQSAERNAQLNLRIRSILESFNSDQSVSKTKNPDPGQKSGK
jgi:hypothetical protein